MDVAKWGPTGKPQMEQALSLGGDWGGEREEQGLQHRQ